MDGFAIEGIRDHGGEVAIGFGSLVKEPTPDRIIPYREIGAEVLAARETMGAELVSLLDAAVASGLCFEDWMSLA